jgi:hypothetical protein
MTPYQMGSDFGSTPKYRAPQKEWII